jgi:hypothetical protein
VSDPVRKPEHYRANGIEAIDVIDAFGLDFYLGNVVKYVLRAGRKGAAGPDLLKARRYLDRRIDGAKAWAEPPERPSLSYLATPYSKYHRGIEKAFEAAARLTARLLKTGLRVYSPIAHTHPIAVHGKIDPLDHAIWMPFDEAMMHACDELIVARMRGWEMSKGVAHEIEFFRAAGKLITHINPKTLAIVHAERRYAP